MSSAEDRQRIARLADELHRLSRAYSEAPRPDVPAGLYRLSELPEATPEQLAAERAIRAMGERLAEEGADVMLQVYDAAVDRHGHHGVRGVSPAWEGVGGWRH